MNRSSVPKVNAGQQGDFFASRELGENIFDINGGLEGHGSHGGQGFVHQILVSKKNERRDRRESERNQSRYTGVLSV